MSRSIWKGPTFSFNLRSLTITPSFINKYIKIPNGKINKYILITNNHIGYKLGLFNTTKIPAIYKRTSK